MTCAALLTLGLAASPVIASQEGIDQSAAPPEATGSGPVWSHLGAQFLPLILLVISVVIVFLFFRVRGHRLGNVPRRPRVFTPELGLTLFFGMFLFGPLFAFAASKWLGFDVTDESLEVQTKLLMAQYLGQAMILIVYIALCGQARSSGLDMRPSSLRAGFFGFGTLLLVWPIVSTVGLGAALLMKFLWGWEPQVLAHEMLVVLMDSELDVWFWIAAVGATILPGIFEEVMYRGLIQETLRRLHLGPWLSIISTSALFAMMHIGKVQPHGLVALFVLSLGFGWAYERSGRLAAPIVMHILFNAGNLGMAMLMK